MKQRNLKYEQKFKTYLFSFDLNTHKEICKTINVKDNQEVKTGRMKPDKEFIKENCEHMIKIIDAFKNCEKDELNDLENMFDTMKEDLKKSLEWNK
jgi:hypothetical protein